MSNKQFISNLSSTYADVRKLDVKKINLKGKNILEYINDATPTIKHSQDTRETVTENDIWGQYIETKDDGTIIVHDDEVINPNLDDNNAWNKSITKVVGNKAYIGDEFYANIQTENIKDGSSMFRGCTNFTSVDSGDLKLQKLTNGTKMFDGCTNLTSFYCDLSSLTNGNSMFEGCTNLSSFNHSTSNLRNGYKMFYDCKNLTSFNSDLSSLTIGTYMFYGCSKLTSFQDNMPSLQNGHQMFYGCSNLKSFSYDLPSLQNGFMMFIYCSNLTSFTSELPSLTYGVSMFAYSNLSSFSSDLSSLTNGLMMFYNSSNLTSFSSDLSSLTNGQAMFSNCSKLTIFDSDLSSLTYGDNMFQGCTNLTTFASDLSSLTYGGGMFSSCKLDAQSVMYIADSIKDITAEKQLYTNGTIPYVTEDRTSHPYKYSAPSGFMSSGSYVYTYNNPYPTTETIYASSVGKLTLAINVTNNSSTIQQQLEDFAKEATYDSWEELKQEFVDKGWKVNFQYGGTSNSIPNTYDLTNGEQIIPCPIFAKLVQVEDKDSAEYCTEDASSFYNIEWGHDVTDTTDYTQFNSLEDAMASWNVFPKENIISTEEEA